MSDINIIGHLEPETGEPISEPLITLDDVDQWCPHTDHTGAATVPLKKSVATSVDRPRTLVCHDMAGGYLDDRFIQGVKHADAYRFCQWANIDTFVYFSHNLVTIPPPCWTNAAHKHGVPILGTFITEWNDGMSSCEKFLSSVDVYTALANKLVAIATYYGFDGWLINIENVIRADLVPSLVGFVKVLTQQMHRSIAGSAVIWYDSVIDSGELKWQNEVNHLNRAFFDACDGIFLNYAWSDVHLERSRAVATESGRPYDVYVGVDVYGRGCRGGGGFNTKEAVRAARANYLSVAIFGQGWTHERLEKADFLENETRFWWYLSPYCPSRNASSLPLWLHFCQGFGCKMYIQGKMVEDSPWSNLSLQSVQPAAILDLPELAGHQTDPLSSSLYTKGAFQGGGCLRLTGNAPQSGKPATYSVLELTTPPYRSDLIISYAFKPLALPDHCTVYLTQVTSHKDGGSPTNHRHLLLGDARNDRSLVKSSDENIREDKVMPLAGDEVKRLLGHYCPEDSTGEWESRFYRVRFEEGERLQVLLCVQPTYSGDETSKEISVLLGQVQILHLTSALREVVLLSDLRYRNADHVTTSTGHEVTLELQWTFPQDSAVYYLLYYQTSCDDAETEFVYLGAAHTNLYKLCGLRVAASTRSLRFKVQPVHQSGLMLPLSSLPSVSYSMQ